MLGLFVVAGEEVPWKAVGSASGMFEGHCKSVRADSLEENLDKKLERVKVAQIQ